MGEPDDNEALHGLRVRLDLRDKGSSKGPLAGLTFAVKDVFDIQGRVTGGGNPDWLASHEPAVETAPAVRACLEAGAHLIGVTVADELCFSPFGENVHYGTPLNPAAPDRVPGGSSSGSASVLAGGLVDFALGTDTAGSLRIPPSYCGLFGIRPTHGRVSAEGVMPLSPSADAVGWMAREASMLQRVGDAMLDEDPAETVPIRRILLLEDAFETTDEEARPALRKAAEQLSTVLAPLEPFRLGRDYAHCLEHFNRLRPREIWSSYGEWIERVQPRLGPLTAARFTKVKEEVADQDTSEAQAFRDAFRIKIADLLGDATVILLPTTPSIAPKKGITDAEAPGLRSRIFRLSCLAPMLGFPEISMSLATVQGCPIGLSLLGPRNSERMLMRAAREVQESRDPGGRSGGLG